MAGVDVDHPHAARLHPPPRWDGRARRPGDGLVLCGRGPDPVSDGEVGRPSGLQAGAGGRDRRLRHRLLRLSVPHRPRVCHRAARNAGARRRGRGRGFVGHGVQRRGGRATRTSIRLRHQRGNRRHGGRPPDRCHRGLPLHVVHVPRVGNRRPGRRSASTPYRRAQRRGGPTDRTYGRGRSTHPLGQVALDPSDDRCADRGSRPRTGHRHLRHLLDPATAITGCHRMADRHLLDAVRYPVHHRRSSEWLAR